MRSLFSIVLLLAAYSSAAAQDTTSNLALLCTFNTDGADSSGNSRNLTADTAGGATAPTHVTGHLGNAMRVDPAVGVSSYKLANASFLNGVSTYTVSCWVRTRGLVSPGLNRQAVMLGRSPKDGMRLEGAFYDGAQAATAASVTATDVSAGFEAPAASSVDGPWTFVALSVSSGTATLYRKPAGGSLTNSVASGTWTLPASGCIVQAGWACVDVDQLRIYLRALNSTDITALSNE